MKDKTRYTSVATENEGHAVLPEEENIEMDEELPIENSNVINPSKPYTPTVSVNPPKRRGYQTVESASTVLMKHLLEEEKKEKEKEKQKIDDIDLFFDTMKATVKKFNAGNKLLAKQRVFSVICELEGFNMNQQQPNQFAQSFSVPTVHHSVPTYSQPTVHSQSIHSPFSPSTSTQTASSFYEAFSPENPS